jgi:hypothetical protein
LGLVDDAATGVRFLMVLDRSALGPGVKVVVKQLRIVFDT